jgi:8-oxo-dGTP pyrophosphatase MutT (NUDIX family)
MKDNHQIFIEKIRLLLKVPMPAERAHIKLAPNDRVEGLLTRKWPKNAKQSAVTFLLFVEDGILKTLLMKRVEYDGVHSGQISLPGGQKDKEDENLLETAIREFHEETGVKLSNKDYIGELSDLYIPPSNFLVQPFIAFIEKLPDLYPDQSEVKELHKVSLEELFNPKNFQQEEIVMRQRRENSYTIKAPCYKAKELCIWGATAMIISELQIIIEENKLILPQ